MEFKISFNTCMAELPSDCKSCWCSSARAYESHFSGVSCSIQTEMDQGGAGRSRHWLKELQRAHITPRVCLCLYCMCNDILYCSFCICSFSLCIHLQWYTVLDLRLGDLLEININMYKMRLYSRNSNVCLSVGAPLQSRLQLVDGFPGCLRHSWWSADES